MRMRKIALMTVIALGLTAAVAPAFANGGGGGGTLSGGGGGSGGAGGGSTPTGGGGAVRAAPAAAAVWLRRRRRRQRLTLSEGRRRSLPPLAFRVNARRQRPKPIRCADGQL